MFGNPITDGVQVAVGTYGYVVSFDLTLKLIRDAVAVQLQLSATSVMSEVLATELTTAELFEYLGDTDCPDFAWSQNGNKVFIFIKTATYPYVSTTRIAFWLYRNSEDAALVANAVDAPGKADKLIAALALRIMYSSGGMRVPMNVQNDIVKEKVALGV